MYHEDTLRIDRHTFRRLLKEAGGDLRKIVLPPELLNPPVEGEPAELLVLDQRIRNDPKVTVFPSRGPWARR